jgi:aspartyl-tRNA(Asn)/glutamyl-tRNA(Gln) amidotransferase subunit B
MEEGSLRCDANISVMLNGAEKLGNKVEVKNMNSIRNVKRAVDHEIERQIEELEKGSTIISETRDFDADSGTTSSLRTKEDLNDYRYFPEPDLSPIIVDDAWISEIKELMPALPRELKQKFMEQYELPEYDAQILTDNKETAFYFEALCKGVSNCKVASNWLMGTVKSYLNDVGITIEAFSISPQRLAELINLVEQNKVSNSAAAQKIFPIMLKEPNKGALSIAEEQNLIQDSSSDSIQPIVEEVLNDMSDKVKAYKSGKKGLIGLFMGEVMKRSKGKADPQVAQKLLKEVLD